MAKGDGEAILEIILGVVGGLALAEILAQLLGVKCPYCGHNNVGGNKSYCQKCNMGLRWKK